MFRKFAFECFDSASITFHLAYIHLTIDPKSIQSVKLSGWWAVDVWAPEVS